MKTRKPKLTSASLHLLRCIAKGQDRIFYMTDELNGWCHIENSGLAVRRIDDDNRAMLTDAGKEFIKTLPGN